MGGTIWRIAKSAVPLLAAALILSPVLATGFYGDDASDANLNGYLRMNDVSLGHAIGATTALWMHANGRLFPLYVAEKFVVFHILGELAAYKAFLFALTLAALLAFLFFARAVAGLALAAAATLVAALSLQMRGYHDALYAYNGMVQIMLLLLFASLACWRAYLGGRARVFGFVALALYVVNGLTYEFSYLFFPLYAALAPRARWREVVRAGAPFAVASALLAATSAWLRSGAAIAAASPYAVGAGVGAYVATLARQLAAALPLSYFAWNPSRIFPPLGNVFDRSGGYAPNLVAAAFFALAGYLAAADLVRARDAGRAWPLARLAWLGAGLWVAPALLVAASVKYQRELAWGIGYLPVLIGVFGVALLLAALFGWLLRSLRPGVATWAAVAGAAALCGFAGALTLADNQRLALELRPWRTSRAVVGAALTAGVAADVATGAPLRVAGGLPWLCLAATGCPDDLDARYFVFARSGRRVDLRPATDAAGALLAYGTSPDVAWVSVATGGTAGPLVYLAALPGGKCRTAEPLAPLQPGVRTVANGPDWVLVRLGRDVRRVVTACGEIKTDAAPG